MAFSQKILYAVAFSSVLIGQRLQRHIRHHFVDVPWDGYLPEDCSTKIFTEGPGAIGVQFDESDDITKSLIGWNRLGRICLKIQRQRYSSSS